MHIDDTDEVSLSIVLYNLLNLLMKASNRHRGNRVTTGDSKKAEKLLKFHSYPLLLSSVPCLPRSPPCSNLSFRD
jgi:hypothetical protein